jgi:hypothetical protein
MRASSASMASASEAASSAVPGPVPVPSKYDAPCGTSPSYAAATATRAMWLRDTCNFRAYARL